MRAPRVLPHAADQLLLAHATEIQPRRTVVLKVDGPPRTALRLVGIVRCRAVLDLPGAWDMEDLPDAGHDEIGLHDLTDVLRLFKLDEMDQGWQDLGAWQRLEV